MDMTRTPDGLWAGSTPLARSARRAPDMPNMRPSDGPLRSASTAPTASPLAARAAARLVVLVQHLLEQARAGVVGDVLVGSNFSH